MIFRRRWFLVIALATVLVAIVAWTMRERAKDNAVEQCIAALKASGHIDDLYERGASVANACAALYTESGCRDAYAQAWAKDTDPARRSSIVCEGCRDAYCPHLSDPKPALCAQHDPNLATAATTWPAFTRVVLVRDLGSKRADRIRDAMSEASSARAGAGN